MSINVNYTMMFLWKNTNKLGVPTNNWWRTVSNEKKNMVGLSRFVKKKKLGFITVTRTLFVDHGFIHGNSF